MRSPPAFWSKPGHPLGKALSPVGAAYGRVVERRLRRAPYRAEVPVICTGNVTMGGVGKTPWTIMLAEKLKRDGYSPHVLTRGYGGSASGPLRVADQEASVVGDEALLLAEAATVWVGADRAASSREAAAAGADILLLDDGFQNPGLSKDLSFLLVDAQTPFGNGRVFPAGPLREKPAAAVARADAVVSVGTPRHAVPEEVVRFAGDRPVLRAWMEMDVGALDPSQRVYAFAGIGRPERFFGGLERPGLTVAARKAFPDHHVYAEDELWSLLAEAERMGAQLVTTRKDHVRLPSVYAAEIASVPARMMTDAEDELSALFEGFMKRCL